MGRLQRSVPTLVIALLLAACSAGSSSSSAGSGPATTDAGGEVAAWTRPADPMSLAEEAGLTPDVKEYFDYHVHAHLDVFVDGEPVEIPGGIGIETTDPAVQTFGPNGFGGIPETGCEQACISPLHTHDVDGVIHIEAPTDAEFTLGQFFEQLDVPLDASCVDEYCMPDTPVAVYVDGEPRSGDPADIVLGDGQEIAIVIGTPPDEIPDSFVGA